MNYFEGPSIPNINGSGELREALSFTVSSIEIAAANNGTGITTSATYLANYLQFIIDTKLTPILETLP